MQRFCVALLIITFLAGPAMSQTTPDDPAYACQPGATLPYPATATIRERGILLSLTTSVDMLGDPAILPQPVTPQMLAQIEDYRRQDTAEKAEALARLAQMSPTARDVTLLSALSWKLAGDRPVSVIVTQIDDRFLPLYLETLDRNGLATQSGIIRAALAAFGRGTKNARARGDLWVDPQGFEMNVPLDSALQQHDSAFVPLAPDILKTAEDLAKQDPQLAAEQAAAAAGVDEMTYLRWIVGQILGCAGDWYATVDREDPFAALPLPQHDLAVLEIFMDEVMNGGTHQFFTNSSDGLSTEVHHILIRTQLPDHAAELKQAMDMLGAPYPRDRTQRSAVMDRFDEAQNDALNAPTGIMDDGRIYAAKLQIARVSGLMTQ